MRAILLFAFAMISCASLTPEQRAEKERVAAEQEAKLRTIRIVTSDPPSSCQDMGSVSGGSYMADEDAVRHQMRKHALQKGANLIRLDGTRPGYSIGTAFKCPEAPPSQ